MQHWRRRSRSARQKARSSRRGRSARGGIRACSTVAPTKRRSPQHEWQVPERYNIAADVCDKHPADKLAMVQEDFDGNVREVQLGRAAGAGQPRGQRAARATAWSGATASRSCCRRRPRPRRSSSAPGSSARSCSRCRCSTATRASAHRLADSQAKVLVTDAANGDRVDRRSCERACWCSTTTLLAERRRPRSTTADTAADDPAQLYYTSGTTGLAKGIVHAHRYLLAHEEFVYCHEVQDGERFHGMGEWAWAAGIAPLLGPWRSARCSSSTSARAASTRTSSSTSSRATASRTSSRRRPRCAR